MPSSSPTRSSPVRLADLTTLGVGGHARTFVRATTASDVQSLVGSADDRGVPVFVLGGGSNVVIADEGFDGCVLQIGIQGTSLSDAEDCVLVTAGAGERWDPLVEMTVAQGLCGLECLSGIPGSVGGTPIQNVGAYGQEVADVIDRVTVYDRERGAMDQLTTEECGFAYRMSRFKAADADRFVVCSVTFRLRTGMPSPVNYPEVVASLARSGILHPTVADIRQTVLGIRRGKGMVVRTDDPDSRSVGSFFMNPIVATGDRDRLSRAAGDAVPAFQMPNDHVKVPAAWLIERAGFPKGYADGPVGISTKHPLAIVNRGAAAARDVLRLAARIKRAVIERFDIWLRPEPVFIGFRDDPDHDFLQKTKA